MVTSRRDRVPSSASVRRFGQRFSGFAVVMLLVVVGGVFALAPGLRNLVEQRQQIADLQQTVDNQNDTLKSLAEQADRWQDPAYIRAQTRQRLFFVIPGEKSFVIVDDTGSAKSSSTSADSEPTTAITSTQYDWRQLVTSSWYSAATSTDARAEVAQ